MHVVLLLTEWFALTPEGGGGWPKGDLNPDRDKGSKTFFFSEAQVLYMLLCHQVHFKMKYDGLGNFHSG